MGTVWFVKSLPEAVTPHRATPNDIGYDLTVVKLEKTYDEIELYNTGIRSQPPKGYYFDMVGRSSLHKQGYIMATGFSVIDPDYRGDIMVPLYKMRADAKLELPARVCQLVLRKVEDNVVWKEMEYLDETMRGDGGFGSSGH